MIRSIEINHFRGILQGKLDDFTPLTILVGPNGCGKSSVLDALLIAASPRPDQAVLDTVNRHAGVNNKFHWLFWNSEKEKPAWIVAEGCTGLGRQCQIGWNKRGFLSLECRANPAQLKLGRFTAAMTPHFSVENREGQCIELNGVPDTLLLDCHGEYRHAALHELYSACVRAGRREQVKSLVAEVVPGLVEFEILTEDHKPILYLIYKDQAIPVALAGDGVHALVRTTLELVSFPGGTVLFEEPEVHQHPAAIRQTMRAILAAVRHGTQVILTTHSLELIDAMLAESGPEDLERLSLYRLELEAGRMISVRKPGAEVAAARIEIEKDLR